MNFVYFAISFMVLLNLAAAGLGYAVLDSGAEIDKFWIPDLYFANAKKADFQTVVVSNRVVHLFPEGVVHFSTRVIMTVACNLNLRHYPMDTQICGIKMLSYGHTMDKLHLSWFPENAIDWNENISMPEMVIKSVTAEECSGLYPYGHTQKGHLTGNFSCLKAQFVFERDSGYHVTQTFIPTALIVATSWVGFWMNPRSIAARVSLSFTSLLSLATMSAGVKSALPPVSYVKAIDIWMGVCITFVISALVEFAILTSMLNHLGNLDEVGNLLKTSGDPENSCYEVNALQKCRNSIVLAGFGKIAQHLADTELSETKRFELYLRGKRAGYNVRIMQIDRWCRYIFPVSFIIFNIGYWIYYTV